MTDPCGALIYTMVLVSASDGAMTDNEINTLGEMIGFLPVFRDFDRSRLPTLTEETISLLEEEEGLDRALDIIDRALPDHLRETAYAIACDVVASDATASQEELRLLEMIRHSLDIDRLSAAAIERGARARHMTLE
ncbi:tellurite resistance TerB family protein [Inquilinus sp. CAU 1745]|uniref:tellurite resistance TerB family protein n=1 Tax=Inquilinus sp. CAU 1745 TaxID=3140369 RepID=UPI00325AB3F8